MASLKFSELTTKKLNKLFGLRRVNELPSLNSWINQPQELTDIEQILGTHYQKLLILNFQSWNEQELSLHFIGPVLGIINFTEPYRFNLFAGREFGSVIGEHELSGKPDGILASGYEDPEHPYFSFQEYKKHKEPDGDPAAQALGAMLAGQTINADGKPMYGAFVIGESWYFMTLEGKNFAFTSAYSATSNDLFDIVKILKSLKAIVWQLTQTADN